LSVRRISGKSPQSLTTTTLTDGTKLVAAGAAGSSSNQSASLSAAPECSKTIDLQLVTVPRMPSTDLLCGMTERFRSGMMSGMQRFVDDDRGYVEWLDHHPDGFVINTGRTPSAAFLMLHHASCAAITGKPARGTSFTGEYTKVCGERNELEDFVRNLGGHAQPCGSCLAPRGQLVPAMPAGGKYAPLREHLSGTTGARVRMTFAAVENLVGRLPESAYRHRAWWGNNDGNVEAKAWLDAGWRVESVNQAAGKVVFIRAADGQPATRQAASRPGYVDPQVSAKLAARAEAIGLDPGKFTRLVAELNDNYSRGNAYATHALLRAILDHIPPLLGCADFKAAVNNYSWSRTDRGYARRLLDFKLQADDALHRQISKRTDQLGIVECPRSSGLRIL
jgi:hypothetical protein